MAVCLGSPASAVLISDDFTQSAAVMNWGPQNGACLTAGNNSGTIPACVGLPYYNGDSLATVGGTLGYIPDKAGYGALRFTDNYNQNGAIVSNFTFPANAGINVLFKTVTYYGGISFTANGPGYIADGADGISFFLMDGNYAPGLGAWGGSLAYSCSNNNNPASGLVGAYMGLGMDEFGNFLNAGDNTATGYGYQGGRIGLRGAGNVAWSVLSTNPTTAPYYPSTLSASSIQAAVSQACSTGLITNYASNTVNGTKSGANTSIPLSSVLMANSTSAYINDYAAIPNGYKVLDSTKYLISNIGTNIRGQATPIAYNLQITQDGLLSLSFSYNQGAFQPVLTNQSITASNGALPSTLRFGFAGSTGGARNIHEILCFQAQPAEVSASSGSLNTTPNQQIISGTQFFTAGYHQTNWWGELIADGVSYSTSTGLVTFTPNWDAACTLMGANNTCAATNTTSPGIAPTSRQIITWNGSQGVPFEWSTTPAPPATLTTAQQTALDLGDATANTSNRLQYLRGVTTNEVNSSGVGLYRARTSILGDIYHSATTWVGPPHASYSSTWYDETSSNQASPVTPPENASNATSYTSYKTAQATRKNVVYAGANDGLLHGFEAGSYNNDAAANPPLGSFNAGSNDGLEVLAYMPGAIVNTIHSTTATADYSSTQYAHAFSVDGTPGTGDLFYNKAWHTWLVGGLGAGGSAIYALDVTNPGNFTESNAKNLVINEWTPGSFTCVNASPCNQNMGNTYGTPVIRRFHNGSWGFIFGNGLNSSSGHAGIYIVLVSPSDGSQSVYYFDTGIASGDGITYTTAADLDGDHIVDYIYAGDTLGNLWRFDVTSTSPASWGVSTYGHAGPTPLYQADQGGLNRPITTAPLVVSVRENTGLFREMVVFGTGQEIPLTVSSPTTYATTTQALYGIWDWDMTAFNSLSTNQAYASLPETPTITITSSNLLLQSIQNTSTSGGINNQATGNVGVLNSTTGAIGTGTICFQGDTNCTTNNQFGWTLPLSNTSSDPEQVIYNPVLESGAIIVNSTIPPINQAYSCSLTVPGGWTTALDPETGNGINFFPDVNGAFGGVGGMSISRIGTGASGSPDFLYASDGTAIMVTQTTSGNPEGFKINPSHNYWGSRVNWTQLR